MLMDIDEIIVVLMVFIPTLQLGFAYTFPAIRFAAYAIACFLVSKYSLL